MMAPKPVPQRSHVASKTVEAAALYREASVMAKYGDPLSSMIRREAERAEAEVHAPVGYSDRVTTVGGEAPLNPLSIRDMNDREMVDTVRSPNLVTSAATLERLRQAEKAGCLEIALDTAETIKASNNLERMLAHQVAAAHRAAMTLSGAAMWHIHSGAGMSERPEDQGMPTHDLRRMEQMREHNCEAARLCNASARMMQAFNDGIVTLAQLRRGGKQHVIVQHQHVNVGPGGRAVVAGRITGSDRRKGGSQTQRGQMMETTGDLMASGLGMLLNGNPSFDLRKVKRCGAKRRKRLELCRQPAMRNGRCCIHGGKSTGPRTAEGIERIRRASTKHGRRSKAAIAERKRNAETKRQIRILVSMCRRSI
ncbi:hypothetical protein G5V57_05260 [Nordella sp. HKS 07]|uniref:HGGxSTG domain-containing protein n=1 Tax=Nordella sp. HKS 07 TaxID=2712222 RepID=UPI0013E1D806|nr:HGGxSTG domain-containing protein [Nordella sp. HKS 07]QIG47194.1 hypothetical protein G5V57_05260 [Nordella sp. HKS 07]